MNVLLRFVWLVVLWMLLWSDLSWANLVGGIGIAALVMALFRSRRHEMPTVRPFPALVFLGYFLFKLVESTIIVAITVVAPKGRTRSGIVAVPLQGCSDTVATLVADAISLTPGSLTLEVRREPLTLYVHVLHVQDVEAVRRDVLRLETLAVKAFGDPDALAATATGGRTHDIAGTAAASEEDAR
jgi:multicomponent Na+:H+ antiporter subunit E